MWTVHLKNNIISGSGYCITVLRFHWKEEAQTSQNSGRRKSVTVLGLSSFGRCSGHKLQNVFLCVCAEDERDVTQVTHVYVLLTETRPAECSEHNSAYEITEWGNSAAVLCSTGGWSSSTWHQCSQFQTNWTRTYFPVLLSPRKSHYNHHLQGIPSASEIAKLLCGLRNVKSARIKALSNKLVEISVSFKAGHPCWRDPKF